MPLYDGGKAQGVININGRETPLISGEDGPGRWLVENLPGGPGSGLTRAWTHVEGHAAGLMHQTKSPEQDSGRPQRADLFINKAPCDIGRAKCRHVLHKLLPHGSVLDVHFPNDRGGVSTWRFAGGTKGWSELR